MTKRPLQQSIVRKKTQQPKRRRLSYLQNHLLTFKLQSDFRVESKRTPNDCFLCTLEYVKILPKETAEMLRSFVYQKGVETEQMLSILKFSLKDKKKYTNIRMEMIEPFDTIYQIIDLLSPSSATILGLQRKNQIGHVVLLAKDIHNNVGIIDTQINQTCVGIQCNAYLKKFVDEPFLIFTHDS